MHDGMQYDPIQGQGDDDDDDDEMSIYIAHRHKISNALRSRALES